MSEKKFVAALTLLLAGVFFARDPRCLLNPQFWAEDGSLFFLQAYEQGFWRPLLIPTAGYMNTFPRLVAALALPFPLLATPLIYNLAAFAVQVLTIPYLLSDRLRHCLPDRRLRVSAALLYVVVPNSYATYVHLTNSQWNLAFVVVLLLLAAPPASRWGRVGETVLLAVFAVTGPLGIIILPGALLNAFRQGDSGRRRWSFLQAGVLAVGAVVQALCLAFTPRTTSGLDQGAALTLRETLQILSTHIFYDSVLGILGTIRVSRHLGLAAQIAGLALVAFLAGFVIVRRHRSLCLLLWLAAATIALSFLFHPLAKLRDWLDPGFGPRYYTFATLFILFAIMLLCLRGGRLRWIGIFLAFPLLGSGIPGDFFHPRYPDTQWAAQIAAFATLPQGANFYIPLLPERSQGISLRKKTPDRGASPLQGMRQVIGRPEYALAPPDVGSSAAWGEKFYLRFAGWATDTPHRATAGGVWAVIDGMWYPVVFGLEEQLAASFCNDPRYRFAGFIRYIPVGEIGLGRHRLSLVVLTHDSSGYYLLPGYDFVVRYFGEHLSVDLAPA